MKYASVCSGIEAPTQAWHALGWEPVWFSEIDPFACAYLTHHYPNVPNRGDMTKIRGDYGSIDLLVGGTPCQSFSVAGLRKGMADPRGNLALDFLRLVDETRPRWVVWENVPGVLSSNRGRDFGTFLGALVELGFGFAYRILDAQYFGLAQRRQRVFVVGHLGDWRGAAAVLFERESMSGNRAPSRKAREEITGTLSARTSGGGGLGTDFECQGGLVSHTLGAHGTPHFDPSAETYIAHTLRGEGFDASEDGTGRGTPLAPVSISENQRGEVRESQTVPALGRGGGKPVQGYPAVLQVAQTLTSSWHKSSGQVAGNNVGIINPVIGPMGVRRLTPQECERLQGFPDDSTLIPYRGKPAADGPRYKAIGNSMAVPVMGWIGKRIDSVSKILMNSKRQEAA